MRGSSRVIFDLSLIDPNPQRIAILDFGNRARDHFQQGWVLEVAQFCLGVGIINPALVFGILKNDPATRKGKRFWRVQIRPLDEREGIFWFEHGKGRRADVDIQRTVEITIQIEPARLEEWTLPVERAVGIVLRRSRRNAVAAGENAGEESLERGHGEIFRMFCTVHGNDSIFSNSPNAV